MKTLKKNWKNGEFGRCYLFFGPEVYLIRDYETTLTKALLLCRYDSRYRSLGQEKEDG